jgi:hypothetical protein
LYFSALLSSVPNQYSPKTRSRKSVKQAHSSLTRRLVPILLVAMTVLMFALILVAMAVMTGLVQS